MVAIDRKIGTDEAGEYVFRYPIKHDSERSPLSLSDLPAEHLRALLDLISPTWKAEDVRIDGYLSLGESELIHTLFGSETRKGKQSDDPLDIYEPRLAYIRTLIESLLTVVEFEYKKEPLQIDGFRIKKPNQWLRPGGGASDILAQAATRCNLKCRFCYNLGSPPALEPVPRQAEEEYKEILTRIAYYVPGSKLGLSPSAGSPCEMLSHPYILEILEALRGKTPEVFRIPTNGSQLTLKIIQALTPFRPLFVDVSLNSSSAERRKWLMRDPNPETALKALALLQKTDIPYSVVIVPWPFPSLEEMVEDLIKTITFSAQQNPAYIQISLPGYTERFSKRTLFDREEVWNRVKDEIQQLRTRVECPLILRPGLFEEYQDPEAVDAPTLIGVIKNSPAFAAGLKIGDRVTAVNKLPVRNRSQTRSLLDLVQRSQMEKVSVTISRSGLSTDLEMDLRNFSYPFDPAMIPYTGCVFSSSGIPWDWMEQIKDLIIQVKAREILILTSTLVQPTLEKRIRETPFPNDVRFHLRVPSNRFLGGNIFMGDLQMAQDFIDGINAFLEEGASSPDLILLPSSPFHLSGWGRDLNGRVYKDIERHIGIPVRLVECDPIFD